MKRMIYKIIACSLFSLHIQAMDTANGSSSAGMLDPIDDKIIFTKEEFLKSNRACPILNRSFKELIEEKHAREDTYLLARTMEQVEGRTAVHYFDAHAFDVKLFNPPSEPLKKLGSYRHPISGLPMQWLEYFACEPGDQNLKLMCIYAKLIGTGKDNRSLSTQVKANQEEDVGLLVEEKMKLAIKCLNGENTKQDYEEALKLFWQVAAQKHRLDLAATAKNYLAFMYLNWQRLAEHRAVAKELYEEVATQKDNVGAAVDATKRLAYMYLDGAGVEKNHAKVKELRDQLAVHQDDPNFGAKVKGMIKELEQEQKKTESQDNACSLQ